MRLFLYKKVGKISILTIVFITLIFLLVPFYYQFKKLVVKANEYEKLQIVPSGFTSGVDSLWQNPNAIFMADLNPDSEFIEFNSNNSTHLQIRYLQEIIEEEEDSDDPLLEEPILEPVPDPVPEPEPVPDPVPEPEPVPDPVPEPEPVAMETTLFQKIINWWGDVFQMQTVRANRFYNVDSYNVLELSNFSTSINIKEAEIRKVRFAISMAAQTALDDKLLLDYTIGDDEWQNIGEIALNGEASNANNGGYYYIDWDGLESWDLLNNILAHNDKRQKTIRRDSDCIFPG